MPIGKTFRSLGEALLDMSTSARMQRAREMGFDVDRPVYHGTSTDFDAFDRDRAIGTNYWSTTDRAAIENGEVGAQGKGVIKEMYQRIQNPAGWKEYDQLTTDELISRGYDGLGLVDPDGHVTYSAFNPNQYRSVDAAFDPAKKDSPDLMAGIGGLAPLAGGAALMGQSGESEAGVFHRTSKVAADAIRRDGVATTKEPGFFVSSVPDGQAVGYGDELIELDIPENRLILDDEFPSGEKHYRINPNSTTHDLSEYLKSIGAVGATGAAALTPEQSLALEQANTPDVGAIIPDEAPYLERLANFVEGIDTPLNERFGSPFQGTANYLRRFGQDKTSGNRLLDAYGAVFDWL